MAELKLARLPSRTPAKITITVPAELNQALRQYADIYRSAYGDEESVAELIPFMLEAFLESDREFAKARRNRTVLTSSAALPARAARPASDLPASTAGKEV